MKRRLQSDFRSAINLSMIDAWTRVPGGPQEPDFVASLVLHGTPLIHNAIVANAGGLYNSVNTVGVFCHQSPMVTYADGGVNRTCELGDVLWCHFHTDQAGYVFRNALLFQSKISRAANPHIPYNDTQLKLYREWPQFSYTRAGTLNGQIRNYLPKQPHDGAQYMIIDGRRINLGSGRLDPLFFRPNPMRTSTVTPLIYADTSLQAELVRFLFWGSGKPFGGWNEGGPNDVWTKVVWDLLRNGMQRAFNRRRAGFNNEPRITINSSDMDGMVAFKGATYEFKADFEDSFYDEFEKLFANSDGGKNNVENNELINKDDGAPSIVIIRTNEKKG